MGKKKTVRSRSEKSRIMPEVHEESQVKETPRQSLENRSGRDVCLDIISSLIEEFSSINGDVANQVMRLGILKEFIQKSNAMGNRPNRESQKILYVQ